MKKWQEWIERYVRQVTRDLPERQRADVADELRSLLTDEVEERRAASDLGEEEIAVAAIVELGEPTAVARRYAPVRPALVSPPLQRPLRLTIGIVSGLWFLFTLLWLFEVHGSIHVVPLRFDFGAEVGPGDLLEGLVANLGTVLLVFIGIDRLLWREWIGKDEPWTPHDLPPLPVGAPISRFDAGVGVVFTLYLLYALHLAPDPFIVGMTRADREPWRFLDPAYRQLLPWIDLALIPWLVMDAWLLWGGEIGPTERWLQAGLGLLSAGVLFRLAAGGPLTVVDHAVDPILVLLGLVVAALALWRIAKAMRSDRSARLVPRANGA